MIQLLVGEYRTAVDTEDIKNTFINYSLKDIRNYGKRNVSYTKPIKVLRTANTEKIFLSLFNFNVVNGYPLTNFVDAELVEDGVRIFKGTIQVDSTTEKYYNIILTSPQFNLFDEMSDHLIKGNDVSSNDISFSPSYYAFDINRDTIRAQMNQDPSTIVHGVGYRYAIADYNNILTKVNDMKSDYPIYPNIAAKEVFDAIFDKHGYTYELSDDILNYLQHLYIPYNNDNTIFNTIWEYAKYRFGAADDLIDYGITLPNTGDYDNKYGEREIKTAHLLADNAAMSVNNYFGYDQQVLKGYDSSPGGYDLELAADFSTGLYSIPIRSSGFHNFHINVIWDWAMYEIDNSPFPGKAWQGIRPTDMDIKLIIKNRNETTLKYTTVNSIDVSTFDCSTGFSPRYADPSIGVEIGYDIDNVYIENGNFVFIQFKTAPTETFIGGVHGGWPLGVSYGDPIDFVTTPYPRRSAIRYDPSSYVSISKYNLMGFRDSSLNLNDLLPINYKQRDLIDDIFKMFNVFVELDPNDNKNVIIKSNATYYDTTEVKDWSSKVDNTSIKVKSVKNLFPEQTKLSFTDDADIYNLDFRNRFENNITDLVVVNDSDYASGTNNIKLSLPSTVFKTIDHVDGN